MFSPDLFLSVLLVVVYSYSFCKDKLLFPKFVTQLIYTVYCVHSMKIK